MMVSVIVPIYNVEKYLRECLDSLARQSFNDYEVILVDDGSTDSCPSICKEFIKKHSKFKYFIKENGGLSSARNFGINKASGEWLMFVDSDDIVSNEFISQLYYKTIENNCMMGVCKFQKFFQEIKPISESKISTTIKKEEFLKQMFDSSFMAAWNKIYHKSLFSNIRYPEGLIHEDFATTYKLVDLVDKIFITNDVLYFYRHSSESITTSKIKNNKINLLEVYKNQIEYFDNKKTNKIYFKLYKECSNQFFKCFGTILSKPKNEYVNYNDFYSKVNLFYKSNYYFLKKLPLSIFNRLIFFFSFKNVKLLRRVAILKRVIRK